MKNAPVVVNAGVAVLVAVVVQIHRIKSQIKNALVVINAGVAVLVAAIKAPDFFEKGGKVNNDFSLLFFYTQFIFWP